LADFFRRVIVGKQEFDRGKSRLRRRFEAVEERDFVETS